MKKIINFRPVPIFFLCVIVGILLVSLLNLVYGLVAIGVLIIMLIVAFLLPNLKIYRNKLILIIIALTIGVTSIGITLSVIDNNKVYTPNVYISGRIRADTAFTAGGIIADKYIVIDNVSYEGNVGSGSIDGKVSIKVDLANPEVLSSKIGDYITVFGTLVPSELTVTDSYSVSEFTSGVKYSVQGEMYHNQNKNDVNFFDSIKVRAKTVMLTYMSADSAELVYSMFFGDSSNMNRYELDAYREIGIAHLFAVSGLHIGVLAAAISFIIKKCKGNKYVDIIVTIAVVLLYAALTGFGVSVMRALFMLVVYKTGRMLSYKHCGISSVCLAGIVILALNPINLFSISFQLSVLAIVGINFFSVPIAKKLKFLPKKLATLISLSVAVNIAIIPIMLNAFGDVSLIFLLANVLLVPLMVAIFPFLLLLMAISICIPVIGYVLVPFSYIFELFALVSISIASLNFLSLNVSVSVVAVVMYMLFMIFISRYIMLEYKTRSIISGAGVAVFISCVAVSSFHLIDFSTNINVVSSSAQHEYVIISEGSGEIYLVINGDYDEYAIRDVADYMNKHDIPRIDGLIKPTFTDKEAVALFNTYEYIKPKFVVTYTYHPYLEFLFDDRKGAFHATDDVFIKLPNRAYDNVLFEIDDVRVGFSNVGYEGEIGFTTKDDIDILFANGDSEGVSALLPDYYISDYGFGTIANTISTKFTIKINDDKIRIR